MKADQRERERAREREREREVMKKPYSVVLARERLITQAATYQA